MSYQEPFDSRTLAISISESDDMPALGLSKQHLEDATAEIARHSLALGARLMYGGDLRPGGFSEVLFELAARHRPDVLDGGNAPGLKNYLAWPVHIQMPADELRNLRDGLDGVAELTLLDLDGSEIAFDDRLQQPARSPSVADWGNGLSAMRRVMRDKSDGRVVLGGRTSGFKGVMPGIAEEVMLAIDVGRPVYLLGGFGGCARSIAEAMGLVDTWPGSQGSWAQRATFSRLSAGALNNGLDEADNHVLARTPHIDQAVMLIIRGLHRLWG